MSITLVLYLDHVNAITIVERQRDTGQNNDRLKHLSGQALCPARTDNTADKARGECGQSCMPIDQVAEDKH